MSNIAPLNGARIMLVEDEAIVALDLSLTLKEHGVRIVGPFHRVAPALAQSGGAAIDAAVLDVDVGGVPVFPLARALEARGVPLLFHTARNPGDVAEFARARLCQKPCRAERLVAELASLVAAAAPTGGGRARHPVFPKGAASRL